VVHFSRENYRRFATAAEAIRYAVETLRTPKALGAWLQVGDERFNSTEIQRLYEAADYPLRHRMTARHSRVREDTMDPPLSGRLQRTRGHHRLSKRS
jgi:Arc/MetJ-type ribon-helix-helix transcriptional regulator